MRQNEQTYGNHPEAEYGEETEHAENHEYEPNRDSCSARLRNRHTPSCDADMMPLGRNYLRNVMGGVVPHLSLPVIPNSCEPDWNYGFCAILVLICNFVVTKTSPSCVKRRKIAKGALQIKKVFAIGTLVATSTPFPGSSAVEQPAVNRLVAGSNPARGATFFFLL